MSRRLEPSRWAAATIGTVVTILAVVGLTSCGGSSSSKAKTSPVLDHALDAHVKGDLGTAKTLYGEVLRQDPKNKFAIYNLGLIAQTEGDLKTAEDDYRKAIAVDPKYHPALFNLAILRANAQAGGEAVELYRRAIAAKPDDAATHLNLGLLLVQQGDTTAGQAEIETAQKINPQIGSSSTTAPPTTRP